MMPIINIHPLASESEAEAFRLTLKDADKFGLYCCTDGTSAMWSVIPKIALELIFNAETGLPVTVQKPMHPQLKAMFEEYFDKCFAESAPQRTWVGLTELEKAEITSLKWWDWEDTFDIEGFIRAIEAKLKEKNT